MKILRKDMIAREAREANTLLYVQRNFSVTQKSPRNCVINFTENHMREIKYVFGQELT